MIFLYLVSFIALPLLASAYDCRYNHSGIAPRKTVVLELENHKYLHIYDATFNIVPSHTKNHEKTSLFLGVTINFIKSIIFKGYIMEDGESKYLDVKLDNLKGFRFDKEDRNCSVSFLETKNKRTDITSEQTTAILRLAESCIQSHVCGVNLHAIDKDGDLYYQSTQSALNALVDFYIPILLNRYVGVNGFKEIFPMNITSDDVYFYEEGGYLMGLDTIQRTKDVFIKHVGYAYSIELGFRISKLKLFLQNATVGWKLFNTFGNFSVTVEGLSLRATIVIDLLPSECSISLSDFKIVAFKSITADVPLWNLFSVEYRITPDESEYIQSMLISYVNDKVSSFRFDCQEYIDKLPEVLG